MYVLTGEQWNRAGPHLHVACNSVFGRSMADTKKVFETLLFILHTGMQWDYLPKNFPPKSTVHDELKR
ncbi:MAG: transposase [Opitutaceae bacterium]|jgi:transposase|nr:transposase [Opitutaceae bacterium]